MFGISSWNLLILLGVAMLLIGPDRLPEYMGKLRDLIRQMRQMSEGAKSNLRDQMGPEFDDINWRQYDPRQYDPRKIIREAFLDEPSTESGVVLTKNPTGSDGTAVPESRSYDPDRMTPYDAEAT